MTSPKRSLAVRQKQKDMRKNRRKIEQKYIYIDNDQVGRKFMAQLETS